MTHAGPFRTPGGPRWRRHDGSEPLPDADYLVAADPSIGPVLSAETNRKPGGFQPADAQVRFQMSQGADLGLGLAIAIAVIWFSSVPVHQDGWKGVFAFVMGLDGASLGLLVGVLVVPPLLGVAVPPLLRRPRSSFVGRDGLQTHVRRLLGGPTTSLVRFADCARMEVERVRHHVNGAYTRTSLRYEFFDATGRARFLIQTQVHEKKKSRPSDQALFAFAAEKAWNEHKARTA